MNQKDPILFYDSRCNLCLAVVKFIQKRCSKSKIIFVALESDEAKEILWADVHDAQYFNSVVLIKNYRRYQKSSAIVEVLKVMPIPWKLFMVVSIVPTPVRDWIYDFIAFNRYRWFGMCENCRFPSTH